MFKRLFASRSRAAVLVCAIAGLVSAFSAGSPASAAMVTKTFDFQASDFAKFGDPSTVFDLPTVTGQVTVTFDPSVQFFIQTAGITLDSLSIPVDSPISFGFQPASPSPKGVAQMSIGGSDFGPGGGSSGTNDFQLFLVMNSSLDGFVSDQFTYESKSDPLNIYFAKNLTVSFGAVPEPATWGLMVGGVALLGGALRRSRRSVAMTA